MLYTKSYLKSPKQRHAGLSFENALVIFIQIKAPIFFFLNNLIRGRVSRFKRM